MRTKRYRNHFEKMLILGIIIITQLLWNTIAYAAHHTINLVVAYKNVNFSGKIIKAISANNQIPAPTLHFKQGDQVVINVYNNLDQGTSIHWHGVLVPWQMDGVEGVSQQPIPPHCVFQYKFTLNQSGTYWYHAHSGLQEQQGLYGAFIIDPITSPSYKYNKDYVIVLSDWSNTNPNKILANLKKDGDYYAPRLPLQPSLLRFIHDYQQASIKERKAIISDYLMMQQMRMSIYDYSDVAYDAFLLNGHSELNPWIAVVKQGDVVRLRFIGASGSTNFQVKIPGTSMQIVHVQGNDVIPYITDHFIITPGETIDALVRIQKREPYLIYAEAADTSGSTVGILSPTNAKQIPNYKNVAPFPKPAPVTREMMSNMMMSQHEHASMPMPTEPTIFGDTISAPLASTPIPHEMTSMQKSNSQFMPMHMEHKMADNHNISSMQENTFTNYSKLTAAIKTNDPAKPVSGVIKMELFGYMNHFIWMINGVPGYKAQPIIIKAGERYRIIFINNSMMHHPMHIHGHWFILRNGHGAYAPLLHTIDIPPGATIITDIDADASGQWFFHCHHLYHMIAGMNRIFQYSTIKSVAESKSNPQTQIIQTKYHNRPIIREDEIIPIDHSLVQHPSAHHAGFYIANFLDFGISPFTNVQKINYKGLFGNDYNKFEIYANDATFKKGKIENSDIDFFLWHLLNQFWAIKGGANYFYRPTQKPYIQPGIGIEGLMPYFINLDARAYYHSNSAKFDLELSRDSQISNNFFIRTGIRGIFATKTNRTYEIGTGLNEMRYIIRPYYRLIPGLDIFAEYEHTQDYGKFKEIEALNREAVRDDTLTFGLSFLF